jgi:hypothetical protein
MVLMDLADSASARELRNPSCGEVSQNPLRGEGGRDLAKARAMIRPRATAGLPEPMGPWILYGPEARA